MSTFSEQFSAAGKSQVEAQIALLQQLTAKSFEGAEKIIALNIATTRASLEQSSAAMRQLFNAKDPRDLIALTTQGQEQFNSMLAYGRALIDISSTVQAKPAPPRLVPDLRPVAANEAVERPAPLPAKVKPIVKAVAKPPAKPVAAPVVLDDSPLVVSGIAPVDATPPAKAPAAQQELLDAKPKKKK